MDIKKDKWNGSITVEATLVLPIFVFIVITFLSFIQFLIMQEKIQHSLTEVAREVSKSAYIYDQLRDDPNEEEINNSGAKVEQNEIINGLASGVVFEHEFEQFHTLSEKEKRCIVGGLEGIHFYKSSFMKDGETIEIVATYRFRLPIPTFFVATLPVEQRVKTRGFIGKTCQSTGGAQLKAPSGEDDYYVYITTNGSVYHKNRDCVHLRRTTSRCTYEELELKRNKNGGKYTPCERCMDSLSNRQPYYYITSDGTKYHATLDCPSLKRSVRMVLKSSVTNRLPCSACCD